ncbi:MAG: YfiR family protein [Acidobacteriaceae bacterium]
MLRRSAWRRASGLLLALIWMLGAANARDTAEAERPSSDDVEAAYLYNFGKFVRWPQVAAQGPLTICVAGRDSMSQEIVRLVAGETIQGRPLEVRTPDRAERVEGCSILFIGSPDSDRLNEFLSATSGKPVLTVGDAPDFLARGGMIQFVMVEDHVRFSVNLAAATHSSLQLSSELLKVALRVQAQPGMGGGQ